MPTDDLSPKGPETPADLVNPANTPAKPRKKYPRYGAQKAVANPSKCRMTVLERRADGTILRAQSEPIPINWGTANSILELISGGMSLEDTCKKVSLSRSAVWQWRMKDTEFARQYQQAEECATEKFDDDMLTLLKEIRGKNGALDTNMLAYFDRLFKLLTWRMERWNRKKFGQQVRVEHVLPENCGEALVKALTEIVAKYKVEQSDVEVAVTLFLQIVQPVVAA